MSGGTLGVVWRSFSQSFRARSQVRGAQLRAVIAAALVAIGLPIAVRGFGDEPVLLALVALAAAIIAGLIGDAAHPGDALDERALVEAGMRPASAAIASIGVGLLAPRSLLYWLGGALAGLATGAGPVGIVAGIGFGAMLIGADRLGVMSGRGLAERRVGREVRALAAYLGLLIAMPLLFALGFLPWRGALAAIEAPTLGAATTVPPMCALTVGHAASPWLAASLAWAGAAVIALAVGLLALRSARRMMRHIAPGGTTRLGALGPARGSAVLVIAWRIATAWLRDRRYMVVLLTVVVLPFLLLIPLWLGGLPLHWLVLVPLPLFGFLLGWSLHNDLAYDSTAVWLHVTSGLPGRADRLGRILPALIAGTAVILVGGALTALFVGGWLAATASAALALALLGVSAGGSSIMSVLDPYPVAQPDASPFSQPVRAWGGAVFSHPIAGLVELALCSPVAWLAWSGVRQQSWAIVGSAAVVALVTAAVMLAIGVIAGGKLFERRSSRLLEFAQSVG